MLANTVQEELKLEVMQKVWQNRRVSSSPSIFEDPVQFESFTSLPQTSMVTKGCYMSPSAALACSDGSVENNSLEIVQGVFEKPTNADEILTRKEKSSFTLDASTLGDLPACYTIHGIKPHQMPVVGVYIDRRICAGFKYRVLPLPGDECQTQAIPYLFNGKALTLSSIGRGYARRFTFESEMNCLNNNENYFWSDNRPEGFAFELELVSKCDKFTVFDANHEAQGILEILKIEGPQTEISSDFNVGGIKKKCKINFIGKVEFYETGVAKPMPMNGIVICLKRKEVTVAEITKVINVTIKNHRYYLTPGIQKTHRRVTVRGEDIGDIPTKYTMTGLEPYEIPVVGTYVDPRIIPGFYYKIRPNDRIEHLFQGCALKLCSIGMGYAKRLTFAPYSLVQPDNYLWSDNHPDGLGLEPRAVHTGMRFTIMAKDQQLGEATVFRADLPQQEEKMEKVTTQSGKSTIIKYIHVNVTCHVKMAITGGKSDDCECHLMHVYGLAVVRKEPNSNTAEVIRLDNVGLDSQLNLLFARTHTELTFHPIK